MTVYGEQQPQANANSRARSSWGIASIVIAGILLVLLGINAIMSRFLPMMMAQFHLPTSAISGYFAVFGVLALVLALGAIACGVVGVVRRPRSGMAAMGIGGGAMWLLAGGLGQVVQNIVISAVR